MSHWLIIDTPFLVRRAFHSMPGLKKGEIPTQVVYAVFKDIVALQEQFQPDAMIFCFDHRRSLRKEFYPDYKKKRHEKDYTEEELAALMEMYAQENALRTKYLRAIGYTNVLWQDGYESDDIIAALAHSLSSSDSATIVSADGDLLQLLAHNVSIWNPATRRPMTGSMFRKEHKMNPDKWALVKEVGGCRTDEVPGCAPGIGEGRAIQYVRGELKGAYLAACESPEALKLRERNRKLTRLPYEGTLLYDIIEGQQLSEEGWNKVCDLLGFSSLLRKGRQNPFSTLMETHDKTYRRIRPKQ